MALTDDTGMVMPVAPMNNYGGGSFGNGFGGDGSWWILLLFILLGGWNNGYGYGGGAGAVDGSILYPWMNQADQVSDGFRDQMINSNISAIQSGVNGLSTQMCGGFSDVAQSLCSGFAGVNATINNGFAGVEASANARQIADMQTAFANQTAMNQGFNSIASQLAQCLKKIFKFAMKIFGFDFCETVGTCMA